MLIRPSLDVPAVLRRSIEAFRAGDPVTLAEAFAPQASLTTQVDAKLARRLGLHDLKGAPLQAQGAIEIMQFYALEFATFDITHFEVLDTMIVGREVAATCEWGMKVRDGGHSFFGRCHNIWTMDATGRKILDGRNVCKIITPSWDHKIN
jgi:hypothetical protein